MKREPMFKINKACDLSSISVLPPQTWRLSSMPPPQLSQPRSQPSQQSFSQGMSSQHGLFSQLSQSSINEHVTNNQRQSSQDRETSLKKTSSLRTVGYNPEDTEVSISRSSNPMMRKWNVPSAGHNEELEHRIGMIETSLNKFGMMMDSVQSDIMQANRGTKEVSLEIEGIRQKLIVFDSSLQQMIRGHEDVKLILDSSFKSINEQLRKDKHHDKLQEILLLISTVQEQMQASLLKLKMDLSMTFRNEMQGMSSSLLNLNSESPPIAMLEAKVTGSVATRRTMPLPQKIPSAPLKKEHATTVPKAEKQDWSYMSMERARLNSKPSSKQRKFSPVKQTCGVINQEFSNIYKGNAWISVKNMQGKTCRVVIESDEEIDKSFACLIDETPSGTVNENYNDEARKESERILRKARKQRRLSNFIVIN